MHLTTKDRIGLLMVASTFGALLLHNAPTGHRSTHVGPVADAGGSVTSAVDVPTYAFVDVNVVPMDRDRVLHHQVVLVRDGFVTRIGDVGVVEPPAGARIVDGGGTRYLAPGLTDAHVHLGDEPRRLLELFVANGVTTVFNLEGTRDHLALREAVRSGELTGPTIYTAGPFVDGRTVRSPADARRTVHQQKQRGFDFVKVHGELSAPSFAALSEAGATEHIAILGHAPRNLPFSAVLDNRQAGVSHAEELIYTRFMSLDDTEIYEVAVDMVEAGTWLTPGIVNFRNIAAQWGAPEGLESALENRGAHFLPPSVRREWAAYEEYVEKDPAQRARIADMLAFHEPLVRTLNEAGVPLLAGTDAPIPGIVPGFALHEEIAALADAGLTLYEALETATSNPGRFVRAHVDPSANFGTVRVGARADLVLLGSDPREHLTALDRPEGVMVRGEYYDRAALDQMLTRLIASR